MCKHIGPVWVRHSKYSLFIIVTVLCPQWSRQPLACSTLRLQHSDSSTPTAAETTTAAEAEKTPVVIDNDLIAKMLKDMENDMVCTAH